MKLTVDMSKCQAYGNCADEAPQLFSLDEWGYAVVHGDGDVASDDAEAARRAAAACPALAIALAD
jgi:ferredoxin